MFKYLKHSIASLLLMTVFLVGGCAKKNSGEETLIPSKFTNIKVYAIDGFKAENIDSEKLSKTSYVFFDEKLTEEIFGNVTYRPSGKVIWKGSYLGIAKLQNGVEKKLRISINGAFYDIVEHKGHYKMTEESGDLFRKKMKDVLLLLSESKEVSK